MSTSLRMLMVEDSENDALLVLRELRSGGYDVTWERVETAETMRAAQGPGGLDALPRHVVAAAPEFGHHELGVVRRILDNEAAQRRTHGVPLPFGGGSLSSSQ